MSILQYHLTTVSTVLIATLLVENAATYAGTMAIPSRYRQDPGQSDSSPAVIVAKHLVYYFHFLSNELFGFP